MNRSAVTLRNMAKTSFVERLLRKRGQAAVEYLLTTVTLVTVFAGLYGFLQGQLRRLFIAAGTKILQAYY
jgi:hypothetical protein